MSKSQRQNPDPPYNQDELQRLADVLGVSALSDEHATRLQHAALEYRFMAETEARPGAGDNWQRLLPLPSKRRKALKRVAKAARAFKDALEDRALAFLDSNQLPAFDPQNLERLAGAADQAAAQIPLGGADPKLARVTFVRRLAKIYKSVTGRPAKPRHDPLSGLDCGPFLEFTKAALRPLNAAALKGLEHDVRSLSTKRSPK